jgi:hypothetical protein
MFIFWSQSGNPGDAQCNGMAVDNGTIYVGTETGVGISTNGGLSFTEATTTNGLGGNETSSIAVGDSLLAAGSYSTGLSLSRDGGKSFINFTTVNGLGGNMVYCISIRNGAIYASTSDGFNPTITIMRPR